MKESVPVTVAVKSRSPAHRCFGQANALFDDYRSHYGQLPSPGATQAWLHDQLNQQRMSVAVADDDADRLHWFITTTVLPASLMRGTVCSIRDLYVAPQHRRAGIASRLLQHAITNARTSGALRVSLPRSPTTLPP